MIDPKPGDVLRGGTLEGHLLTNVIIDPGSSQSLLDVSFADKYGISYQDGSDLTIELANGAVEKPVGQTDEKPLLESELG